MVARDADSGRDIGLKPSETIRKRACQIEIAVREPDERIKIGRSRCWGGASAVSVDLDRCQIVDSEVRTKHRAKPMSGADAQKYGIAGRTWEQVAAKIAICSARIRILERDVLLEGAADVGANI